MGNQVTSNKKLYHIVTDREALDIHKSGFIEPWEAWSYMSVNLIGEFDSAMPLDGSGESCTRREAIEAAEKGREGWIGGRSYVPNIFLTDSLEVRMPLRGSAEILTHAYAFTVKEIMEQGLRVFKNPSAEFPNLYNVPCIDERGLRVVDFRGRVMHAPETVTELLKKGKL